MLRTIYIALDKSSYGIAFFIEKVIGVALGVLFLLIFAEVMGRSFFGSTISWVIEAVGFLLAIITFFGISVYVYKKNILSIDYVKDKIFTSDNSRIVFNLFVWCLLAVYAIVLIKEGTVFALRGADRFTPSREFELFYARMILPVGGVLLLLQAVANFIKDSFSLCSSDIRSEFWSYSDNEEIVVDLDEKERLDMENALKEKKREKND